MADPLSRREVSALAFLFFITLLGTTVVVLANTFVYEKWFGAPKELSLLVSLVITMGLATVSYVKGYPPRRHVVNYNVLATTNERKVVIRGRKGGYASAVACIASSVSPLAVHGRSGYFNVEITLEPTKPGGPHYFFEANDISHTHLAFLFEICRMPTQAGGHRPSTVDCILDEKGAVMGIGCRVTGKAYLKKKQKDPLPS